MAILYAYPRDLYRAFGEDEINQVSDDDRTGTPNPLLVREALARASALITAALVGRYRLPLSKRQQLLTDICCDLAREALYADKVPKDVRTRADMARALLDRIARGELRFDAESPAEGANLSDARIAKRKERMAWP
ncbi:MAG: DUF1320 domain-containing protein [Zoogloeaceae bacterium]|jgi:phage gp36-like protein|nr:DUF1320 domain-containing protein [Zoogloeaceae bacterium]